jgi:sulfide:quinone oxidoreductase
MGRSKGIAHYDGYGSCPLTVERGKIVLAEFGYGGKAAAELPEMADRRHEAEPAAWLLKERILPPIYWKAMLKGQGMDGQAGSRRLS